MIKPKIMFNKFYKTILYLLLLMTEVSAQGLLWQYAIRSEGCDLIDSSLNPECQQFELYALKYDSKVCLVAKNKKGEGNISFYGQHILVGPRSTPEPIFLNYIFLSQDMNEVTFKRAIQDAGYIPFKIED